MLLLYLILITILAYLIGAVPVGALIARFHKIDISQHGSGKMGSTNVLRTVGRRAAVLVLLGDGLKGVAAVLVAQLIAHNALADESKLVFFGVGVSVVTLASVPAAVASVAGHVWSIYLRLVTGKWNGGRGVATALGAALILSPLAMLAALAVGIPTIVISRYVSLGSILGTITAGLTVIGLVVLGQTEVFTLLFISLCIFIIAAHRDNIERLLKGTERKIGDRVKV